LSDAPDSPPFVLLDTNVLLRHFVNDDPVQSPRASEFLRKVERGEIRARLTDIVIFETVYTLGRTYRQTREVTTDLILGLLDLPGIVFPGKRAYFKIMGLYSTTNLSLADCYHAVLAQELKVEAIVSFDRGFDRVANLRRVEP
jgi:predicted nucleic acid-binding protein